MNRSYLTSALNDIAESKGYSFRSAPQEYMNSLVSRYPAAFMPYPEFRSIEGRRRGRITYRLTLHLLADGARLSPADRERSLARRPRTVARPPRTRHARHILFALLARPRAFSRESLSVALRTHPHYPRRTRHDRHGGCGFALRRNRRERNGREVCTGADGGKCGKDDKVVAETGNIGSISNIDNIRLVLFYL